MIENQYEIPLVDFTF